MNFLSLTKQIAFQLRKVYDPFEVIFLTDRRVDRILPQINHKFFEFNSYFHIITVYYSRIVKVILALILRGNKERVRFVQESVIRDRRRGRMVSATRTFFNIWF